MRSRLRLFALVGVIATLLDFVLFLFLEDRYSIILADIVALLVAASAAYLLNRTITFKGNPKARWVSHPGGFALTAAVAGLVDIIVLLISNMFLPLLAAKTLAILVAAIVRWLAYRWVLFGIVRKELAQKVDRPVSSGDVRLSVVIPAYNEGKRIISTVEAIDDALDAADFGPYEIIVVDDGSSDDTASYAEKLDVRVVRQPYNQGKGAAVKAGVLASKGRCVVFTDADLAYPPSMLLVVMEEVEKGWDVVVGSRRHDSTHTVVPAKKLRELGGWCINRLTHLVLLGHFRDTQCGIKGFRGDIARVLFDRARIKGFAFDVEVFLMAEQDGLSLQEIPVFVENRAGSSVSLVRDTAILVQDLFRMRRWVGKGEYRPTDEHKKVLQAGKSGN